MATKTPAKPKNPVGDPGTGVGPSLQTISIFGVRGLTLVIAVIIAVILALAGLILPNLPASKIPPPDQQTQ